jgi:polyphosphate glucokinase
MKEYKVLSIDIGGTRIKATVLNAEGEEIEDYKMLDTPKPASPENVLVVLKKIVEGFNDFDYISVGFPGYVKNGIVKTAPNLGTELWQNTNYEKNLSDALGKPTQVVNDADMQGLGVVSGKDFEILVTLGTGFGTAFLKNGILFPHIELAHHPVVKNKDYDQYIGDKELKVIGAEKWNTRMKEVIQILKTVFNYDRLYIGGGNARFLEFKLDDNIKIVTNEDGIKGGARLWKNQNK